MSETKVKPEKTTEQQLDKLKKKVKGLQEENSYLEKNVRCLNNKLEDFAEVQTRININTTVLLALMIMIIGFGLIWYRFRTSEA